MKMRNLLAKTLALVLSAIPTAGIASECTKYIASNYSRVTETEPIDYNVCVAKECHEIVNSSKSRRIDNYYETVVTLKTPQEKITLVNLPEDTKVYTTDKSDSCIKGDLLEEVEPKGVQEIVLKECDYHIKLYSRSKPAYRLIVNSDPEVRQIPKDIAVITMLEKSKAVAETKVSEYKTSFSVNQPKKLNILVTLKVQPSKTRQLLPERVPLATPYPELHWNFDYD